VTATASARLVRPARTADWPAIEDLLVARRLPTAGARAHLGTFLVAEQASALVGCAGIELYDDVGLLRSVAVDEGVAGHGLGTELVAASLDLGRRLGLRALFLLTTTASGWFLRFGFESISREALPATLAESEELRGACPASALAMQRLLAPR
jgi:amino-acid N-acetyltransferase